MKKILIVYILSLCFGLNGQKLYHSQHLRFDHVTIEDGLPGNSAHAFMQDRLGYLWMGTFNGLVRYDGVDFKVFKESQTENSITGKFITSLFEDSTGKIWIGTMFHGLNCYEPQTGHFIHFPYDPKKENSLAWSYVTSINEDRTGRIWISTVNGLNYLEKGTTAEDYKIHTYYSPLYSESLFQRVYQYIQKFPTIDLSQVGDNANLTKDFSIDEETIALIVHEGEYAGKGKWADYGWITDSNNQVIWQADLDKSQHDGANYKNRIQIETQLLSTGTYQLHYQSDENHAYDTLNYPKEIRPFDQVNRRPLPEHASLLWGIKVILLPKTEGEAIQKLLETENISFDKTIQNSRIYTLFKDNQDQLWIGSAGGLSQILLPENKEEAIRFQHFKPNPENIFGLQSDIITQIKQKDDQTLFIVGMSYDEDKKYGLTIENFQTQTHQFKTIYKNPSIRNYTQILELPNKDMWVAGFSDGLYKLKSNPNGANPYAYETTKYELPNDFVWQLYQDKSGIIWAGTWQAGGFKLNSSVNVFPFYILEENTNIKEEELAVISVLEDSDENLWLGTRGIGLYKWDRKTHLYQRFQEKDGLIKGAIRSLKEDSKKQLWIGTDNGLCRYDLASHTFQQYLYTTINTGNKKDNVFVFDIQEDTKGRIWLGTNKGLYLYQAENDDFVPILIGHKHSDVETEWLNKIRIDQEGNLWLTYYFEGIVKTKMDELAANLSFGSIERFFDIHDLDVIDLHLDAQQQLWLGDHQVGLQKLDIKTEKIAHYPRKDEKGLNNVSAIIEDKNGNLWLSNSKGLSVFNKKNQSFKIYTKDDGIDFDYAKPGPSVMTRRGEFLIGGVNGFYLFNPDSIHAPNIPPIVTLTDFKLFNKSLKVGKDKILKQNISYTKEINLNYNQHTIAISYAGLHFDKPKSIQYACQLEGLDHDWMEMGDEKIARYSNLSPGSYLFKVKAANRGDVWSPKIATLQINIAPPWWQTIWFYLGLALLVAYLVYYFYNLQLNRQLERAEAQRLKDLDEMKSRFFVNVAHELRTPLTLILGPLSSITKRGNLDHRTLGDLKLMRSNGRLLLKLINEILELSRLEANKIELKEKPTLIYPLMHRSIAAFESGAQYRDIQLTFVSNFDKKLQLLIDVSKFEKILFNLIINALKFTSKGGKVTIKGNDLGHYIQIKVEDTGQGIHPDDLPRIFDRFYQTRRPNAIAEGGTGVGLALSKQFAQVLGGNLTVESTLGKGSTFIFMFPKKEVFGVPVESQIKKTEAVLENEGGIADSQELVTPFADAKIKENASILVVEDNRDMQVYIKSVLADDYKVILVENGQEALDYLMNEKANETTPLNHKSLPSLIVSDVMMPVMDGFSLLEKVKKEKKWQSIPFIMLTARIEKQDRLRALRIGVDDYLTKPFEQDELLIRIDNLLTNYYHRQKVVEKNLNKQVKNGQITQKEAIILAKDKSRSKADMEWLENLEQVMKAKVDDAKFTVSQMAFDLHMSERQIHRKIKELTGLPPKKYLKEVRLQTARFLLENQDCSTVKEACYSVGFRKVDYFSQQFKNRFGKSPSELL